MAGLPLTTASEACPEPPAAVTGTGVKLATLPANCVALAEVTCPVTSDGIATLPGASESATTGTAAKGCGNVTVKNAWSKSKISVAPSTVPDCGGLARLP